MRLGEESRRTERKRKTEKNEQRKERGSRHTEQAGRSQAHSPAEGRDGWPQKSLPAKPHQPSEAQTRTEQLI